jgi:arylsulfatase A-like enzyme
MNYQNKQKLLNGLISSTVLSLLPASVQAEKKLPNIVFILADDMGYGDVQFLNPAAKTETPHIDQLAKEGVAFSEAFSSAGVSTPSRYGILTGRYCFRSPLKSGAINGHGSPVIEKDRRTLATMLKEQGYSTAIIGKWHLGVEWQKKDKKQPLVPETQYARVSNVDYRKGVSYGPDNYGFGHSYILPASLDMPPYLFLKNGKLVGKKIIQTTDIYPVRKSDIQLDYDSVHAGVDGVYWGRGIWWRAGEMEANFRVERCLQDITEESLSYIQKQASSKKPFFLYMPLTSPHTPWMVDPAFKTKGQAGDYGSFVAQTDDVVGQVVAKLKKLGIYENTLIIFASDNGAAWTPKDIEQWNHNANEGRRGQKADVYDGGHHIPLVVTWKNRFDKHFVNQPVSLVDIFSTLADLTNYSPKSTEAEDSYSFLPLLLKKGTSARDHVIFHSASGMFGIREGDWKLIEGLGSGGFTSPRFEKQVPGGPEYQLYNIKNDPLEQVNLYLQYPEIAKALYSKLQKVKNAAGKH